MLLRSPFVVVVVGQHIAIQISDLRGKRLLRTSLRILLVGSSRKHGKLAPMVIRLDQDDW